MDQLFTDTVLPDVIEEGLDVFINEDHQDQTGEGSAHRPPQDQPKLLTALKGIFFQKTDFWKIYFCSFKLFELYIEIISIAKEINICNVYNVSIDGIPQTFFRFVDIIDITVHDRFWNVGQANCILKIL